MAWSIELDKAAEKELSSLDHSIASRLIRFLDRLGELEDPRGVGEALSGSKLEDYWKHRVGDYRQIADIQDKRVRILIVRLGNRREVYRQ